MEQSVFLKLFTCKIPLNIVPFCLLQRLTEMLLWYLFLISDISVVTYIQVNWMFLLWTSTWSLRIMYYWNFIKLFFSLCEFSMKFIVEDSHLAWFLLAYIHFSYFNVGGIAWKSSKCFKFVLCLKICMWMSYLFKCAYWTTYFYKFHL